MPGAARHTLHKLKVSACNLRFMAKRGGDGEAARQVERKVGQLWGLHRELMTGGVAKVSFSSQFAHF